MVIGPRRESRFRQLEPIKNKKGQEEKSEMKFEKSNTKWALGGLYYLKSLVLVRHLKI
jgi:hypothetical protein